MNSDADNVSQLVTGQAHPLANAFPLAAGEELKKLVQDILTNGLRNPIVVTPEGLILDGRNRYAACMALVDAEGTAGAVPAHAKVRYQVVDLPEQEQASLVLSLNVHRRHLSTSQRAMAAARASDLGNFGKLSLADRAAVFSVSTSTLQQALHVLKIGDPAVLAAVDSDSIVVSMASSQLKKRRASDPALQAAAVERKRTGEVERLAKRDLAERQERIRLAGEAEQARLDDEKRARATERERSKPDYEKQLAEARKSLLQATRTLDGGDDASSSLEFNPEPPLVELGSATPPLLSQPGEVDWSRVAAGLTFSSEVKAETLSFPNRDVVRIALHLIQAAALTDEERIILFRSAAAATPEAALRAWSVSKGWVSN